LRALGEKYAFSVHVFEEVRTHTSTKVLGPDESDSQRVSATRVRELLMAGDFSAAAILLARPYTYSARVQHGQKLGRTLGFPTANLPWPQHDPVNAMPMRGVYAVCVQFGQAKVFKAVASLGTRPVVQGIEPLLEVHVLDFRGELYGLRMQVEFVAKLREEWNFPNLDALVAQIKIDVDNARAALAHR
jgi:riboflavin kinase / FMN adenylyltransferase